MSVPTTSKSWVLANKPTSHAVLTGPNPTFKLTTKDLPALKDNQVLLKTLFLSNDPAQRGWIAPDIPAERLYVAPVEVGEPMRARGLAVVIESKAAGIEKGATVSGNMGWNEYVVMDKGEVMPVADLPGGLSVTHYLGALGGTGLTAYYGLVVVCEGKKEDTVLVSGAAGATGSMVVQIAKRLLGCKKVIGLAGTDDKCKWVESLGADQCINYKKASWEEDLKKATQGGVDVYFDNVGGPQLDAALGIMNQNGRVAACGAISGYNGDGTVQLKNYFSIITMRLQIRGFIVLDYLSKAKETIGIFVKAIQEGKLKIGDENEHVEPTKFEQIPNTWMKLFEGANTGKLITKL